MNSFHYTIENIVEATRLSRKYIDRCHKRMPLILGPHRQRREKNKFWYDHGAVEIFQSIAQLKGQGLLLPDIQIALEKQFGSMETSIEIDGQAGQSMTGKNGEVGKPDAGEAPETPPPSIITILQQSHTRELEMKDQVIQMLSGNLKLLDEGRGRREEREANLRTENAKLTQGATREAQKATTRQRLLDRLAKLNGWRGRKERGEVVRLLRELEADAPK